MGNVQFGGPAEKQSTLGRHVHKILAVRGNYLLPIFFGFGSWAKAKAVFTMAKMSSFCPMIIFYQKKK